MQLTFYLNITELKILVKHLETQLKTNFFFDATGSVVKKPAEIPS